MGSRGVEVRTCGDQSIPVRTQIPSSPPKWTLSSEEAPLTVNDSSCRTHTSSRGAPNPKPDMEFGRTGRSGTARETDHVAGTQSCHTRHKHTFYRSTHTQACNVPNLPVSRAEAWPVPSPHKGSGPRGNAITSRRYITPSSPHRGGRYGRSEGRLIE